MRPRIWCSDRDDGGGIAERSLAAVLSRELGMRRVLLPAVPGTGGACVRCGAGVDVGTDGPREWRGARRPDGRGVVPGSAGPRVFDGTGVMGPRAFLCAADISDSGGDGGVVCSAVWSDLTGGGVETEGDETVVAVVDASESGDGGRNASAIGLRSFSRSRAASARRSLLCTISSSTLCSDNSSRSR
jgi:hypothetical protein